jgi:aspartyl-tRNA(Asn)/glutamyl-tRNA(Gln) amidotransferase subunit B
MRRFASQYGLGAHDARRLTVGPGTADYYEAVVRASGQPRLAANWITVDLAAALHRDGQDISRCPIEPDDLASLIGCIVDGTLSGTMAKRVFEAMWRREGDPISIIERQGLTQISDSETIDALVDRVLASHPAQVDQFRAGKTKLLGFFVGQVMKMTGGQANPERVNHALRRKL